MRVPVGQLRQKISECITLYEEHRADHIFTGFWLLSGALAAKLEDYDLHDISTGIMKAGREFNPDNVCYLLQQADERLSHVKCTDVFHDLMQYGSTCPTCKVTNPQCDFPWTTKE